ncbi:AraC family transcriptional regulator [Sulfurospirillum barnesii]|uniref:DNA-binding domain-containing protein, AraC-type n=1 Tax=Sulfurospirillum barnesii (strain ATCC 700032 / DSM 10660 / SES-3) TaxID=760154 RepID=I3XWZ5_SULBS|nr:AraC family transcriptional regulator [Sulfurospirillum barnesii]AFL68469.1 DNA-binding domain-containing protein, AraC-type [Sulfurospirillum barnesii SES-3]
MILLSLKDAMKIYQYSFMKHPKFGLDLHRDNVDIDGVAILEKDVNLQKKTALKFDFYALLLCLDGELIRHLNHYTYTITKHTLQLIPPNTIYSFENITETTEIYILLFSESYIKAYQEHHISPTIQQLFDYHHNNLSPVHLSTSMYTRILNLYMDINTELHEKQEGHHLLIRLIILKLLMLLKREKMAQKTAIVFTSRAQHITHCYLELIEKHFLEYKKVSDYAQLLHISSKHLGETIKETLGKNALSCIHHRLFKEALYLLEYTNLSIAAIASMLGFQTPSEFSRFFKSYHTMTPKAFRLGLFH